VRMPARDVRCLELPKKLLRNAAEGMICNETQLRLY